MNSRLKTCLERERERVETEMIFLFWWVHNWVFNGCRLGGIGGGSRWEWVMGGGAAAAVEVGGEDRHR